MNFKDEILNHIGGRRVFCADIYILKDVSEVGKSYFTQLHIPLSIEYNNDDWDEFLKELEVNSTGWQSRDRTFGTIWYENETWSSKGMGMSDSWVFNKMPKVPLYLYEK